MLDLPWNIFTVKNLRLNASDRSCAPFIHNEEACQTLTRHQCAPAALLAPFPTSVCFHLLLRCNWKRFSSRCQKHRFWFSTVSLLGEFCFMFLFRDTCMTEDVIYHHGNVWPLVSYWISLFASQKLALVFGVTLCTICRPFHWWMDGYFLVKYEEMATTTA